jgi:hypothetical protein
MRTVATVLFSVFVLALVQLVASFSFPLIAVATGFGIGATSIVLPRWFPVEFRRWWSAVAVVGGASLAGTLMRYVGNPDSTSWLLWLAPVAAASTAEVAVLGKGLASLRCALCRHRTASSAAYDCPRCRLKVCEKCWSFQDLCCRLCKQNKLAIFSPDSRWWDKQFGLPLTSGLCQLCQTQASVTELRACGKCGRPQCRACWDFTNGRCSHCDWAVAELPGPLGSLYRAV